MNFSAHQVAYKHKILFCHTLQQNTNKSFILFPTMSSDWCSFRSGVKYFGLAKALRYHGDTCVVDRACEGCGSVDRGSVTRPFVEVGSCVVSPLLDMLVQWGHLTVSKSNLLSLSLKTTVTPGKCNPRTGNTPLSVNHSQFSHQTQLGFKPPVKSSPRSALSAVISSCLKPQHLQFSTLHDN